MVLLQSPLLYVLGGGFLAYVLYTRITLYLARKRMMKEYGCEPCPHVYNTDNIIGLNVIRETVNNANNRCALRGARDRFINQKTNTFHTRTTRAPMIATIEPENIKTILSLKFNDYGFGNRSEAFTPLLGDGIFNNDGEKWSRSRHLLRPNFVREQVADLESLERHFQIFLKHIPRDGRVVDLQPLFFKLTIDTATEFLFNHSTNSLRSIGEESENNDDAIFARAFNYAQSDILTRFRWAFLDFLRPNKEGKEAIRICHEYVEKFVDEAIRWRRERETEKPQAETEDDDTRYVFIRELAKQTDDKVRIRSELINILLAGRDTTASLLSNTFFELAKRPDVWAKLKAEVNMLEGKLPSYQQLKNMKYLKWCFNESLRIYPVVPANSRQAIRDTVLPLGGGPNGTAPLFVPAGTAVGYSTYTLHRRPDFYGEDSEEYRPERWETLRPSWEYIPFNGGPRICLGQQYALTEAGYTAVRLVQEFFEMREQGYERRCLG